MTGGLVCPGESEDYPRGGAVTSLVLRAWVEPGADPQLRARVVEVSPGRGERQVIVTTSVEEACRAVRNWLEIQKRSISDGGDDAVTHRG
jgi:hypothetical protein